jgi:hypothetical protein
LGNDKKTTVQPKIRKRIERYKKGGKHTWE